MSKTSRRIKTHKKAKQQINDFYDNASHCLIIHYSCESFYGITDGKTPRITSIAVRFLATAQTKSFSIHKKAELKKIPIDQITYKYDELEKEMLQEFFKFMDDKKDYRWIHWNMRDIQYGFEALKHRAEILGAKSYDLKDENKFDLARLLKDKYGKSYSTHPRLPSILEMNNISSKDCLNGSEEAKAFEEKHYVELHQSTLAKVNVIENILKLTAEDSLKTKSKLVEIYGLSPQGIFELAKDYWIFSLIMALIMSFLSVYLGKII